VLSAALGGIYTAKLLIWESTPKPEADMFELQAPWWEMPARAVIVYAALLILVRLSGRRTVGQFTPFDLLVVMLLSESVFNALSGSEHSISGGLLAAATLVGLNLVVAMVTSRSERAHYLVEVRPVLITRDGVLFHDVLLRNHVPAADFEAALREADCDLAKVACAFLEADGKISLLK